MFSSLRNSKATIALTTFLSISPLVSSLGVTEAAFAQFFTKPIVYRASENRASEKDDAGVAPVCKAGEHYDKLAAYAQGGNCADKENGKVCSRDPSNDVILSNGPETNGPYLSGVNVTYHKSTGKLEISASYGSVRFIVTGEGHAYTPAKEEDSAPRSLDAAGVAECDSLAAELTEYIDTKRPN